MSADPTERFSDRVDNYIKFRPGYPPEVIEYLKDAGGLYARSVIADVGAGTGIFTKLLLEQGCKVYAVDPNKLMLDAAINELAGNKNFIPVNAAADATTLIENSIDMITCAQAFHWFNNEKIRTEFKRILKENGKVALIWNNRLTHADDFAVAYDKLLKNDSTDYTKVNHQNISDIDFKAFFKNGEYRMAKYPNQQIFDEEGLIGRAYSSSYVPAQHTEAGKKFLSRLKDLFNRYKESERVVFQYETEIYLGEV